LWGRGDSIDAVSPTDTQSADPSAPQPDARQGTQTHSAGFDSFLQHLAAAPSIQPTLAKLSPGTVVAETYRVEAKLGAGGMGAVFRATDLRLKRKVALKVHTRTRGKAGLELLRVEARALAHLTHPNVVEVFEVGTHEGRLFIAMEFVDGGTLEQWQKGRPWREVVQMYIQAAQGLAAAHRAGLVHRDFKPANVLVGRDGRPRVADFGLVLDVSLQRGESLLDSDDGGDLDPANADSTPLIGLSAHAMVGTPRYMAPEQAAGIGADHRADQYALCSALFEALSGDVPMDDITTLPTRPGVPDDLWRALVRGLAEDPKRRHEDTEALLEALQLAIRPPRRVVGPALAAVGGTGLVVAAVLYAGDPATALAQCQREGEATVTAWTDERARLTTTLGERGDTARADAFATQLDAYSQRWLAMHEEACNIANNERQRDTVMRCLDRSARAVENTAVVVRAAPPAPDDPIRALPLPPLDACALDQRGAPVAVDARTASAIDAVLADVENTNVQLWNGDPAAARAVARSALEQAQALQHKPTLVTALLNAGDAELESGRLEPSREYYVQAFYLAQSEGLDEDAVEAGGSLVEILKELGDLLAADRWANHALSSFERLQDNIDPEGEISLFSSIGNLRAEQGRNEEALEIQRRILAQLPTEGDEVRRSKSHNSLGATLYNLGDEAGAIEQFELALALNDVVRGPNHPDNVYPLANLAWLLIEAEELDRAEPLLDRAITLLKDKTADDVYALTTLLSHRGALQAERGDHVGALKTYAEGLALARAELAEEHGIIGTLLNNRASSLEALGKLDDAREDYARAIRVLERLGDPDDDVLVLASKNLAQLVPSSTER